MSTSALASCCYGYDLVFIASNRGVTAEQKEVEAATEFYGLNLRIVRASSGTDNLAVRAAAEGKRTIGVVVDADALTTVDEGGLLRALIRNTGNNIPLLILGIGPDLSPAVLSAWSGGQARKCSRIEWSSDAKYVFGRIDGMAGQLANPNDAFSAKGASYFTLDVGGTDQWIESVRDEGKTFPIFIKSAIGRQIIYLACGTADGRNVSDDQDIPIAFLRIAPAMMFVKYSAGERAWHTTHYYANFTIDDPWLREPYGYLDYKGLLGEMEKHNFHTTIAFIPWNYDRSQPQVASLIRNHPDRFSIAVHGDNHDHKEFEDYRSKSFAVQVGLIKQALVRMERFQALTGIPYDRVMVFPHSIAPEQTLGALKRYNYLATVNSSNIPQGANKSLNVADVLRPVTMSFEGFPSIRRYSAEVQIPREYVAINQFLGNPLFFYAHSEFFSDGIGAFDQLADDVNKSEPATEWRSLGDIVRHLYAVKLRDDSNYDVLALSNDVCLENTTGRLSTYYVEKGESGGQAISSVTVDGKIHPYTLQEGKINLDVSIPIGGTSCIVIQYLNDAQSNSIDPAHDSAVVYWLRMGSDFRDIYLAKSGVGLAVIRFYNEHRITPLEVVGCLFFLLIAVIYSGYLLRRSMRARLLSNQGHHRHVTQ